MSLRFVLHRHTGHGPTHFDLMLECAPPETPQAGESQTPPAAKPEGPAGTPESRCGQTVVWAGSGPSAQGGLLATWQFLDNPSTADLATPLPCRRLADHRRAYLDYEGPVSRSRGEVKLADAGLLRVLQAGEDRWRIRLSGVGLSGLLELRRQSAGSDQWTLVRLEDRNQ